MWLCSNNTLFTKTGGRARFGLWVIVCLVVPYSNYPWKEHSSPPTTKASDHEKKPKIPFQAGSGIMHGCSWPSPRCPEPAVRTGTPKTCFHLHLSPQVWRAAKETKTGKTREVKHVAGTLCQNWRFQNCAMNWPKPINSPVLPHTLRGNQYKSQKDSHGSK